MLGSKLVSTSLGFVLIVVKNRKCKSAISGTPLRFWEIELPLHIFYLPIEL